MLLHATQGHIDQQTHHANGVPTLLTINDAIWQNDVQRIIPNLLGKLERDAVLNEIRRGLDCVPLKRHEHYCIDINVFTQVRRALQAANSTKEQLFEIARFDEGFAGAPTIMACASTIRRCPDMSAHVTRMGLDAHIWAAVRQKAAWSGIAQALSWVLGCAKAPVSR